MLQVKDHLDDSIAVPQELNKVLCIVLIQFFANLLAKGTDTKQVHNNQTSFGYQRINTANM
jgi:hypothetical protein